MLMAFFICLNISNLAEYFGEYLQAVRISEEDDALLVYNS